MKILLINGSPHKDGCTKTALKIAAEEIEKNGVETEIFDIGTDPIRGCIGCGTCAKQNLGRCVFDDDCVNRCLEIAKDCDGFIVGTPVHYAAAGGAITSFMDRLCYSGGATLSYKPASSVVSCRRGGASAAFDQLNKYFSILNMPIVSSNYWNMVHGSCADDVLKDEEGVQTMRILGRNMAWLVKAIECAKENGVPLPEKEAKIKTNYIR